MPVKNKSIKVAAAEIMEAHAMSMAQSLNELGAEFEFVVYTRCDGQSSIAASDPIEHLLPRLFDAAAHEDRRHKEVNVATRQ